MLNIEDYKLNRTHFCISAINYKELYSLRFFSPRLINSNGLVNQIFTRPFSLAVQKVVQNYIMRLPELNITVKFFHIFSINSFFTRANPSIGL